MSCAVLKQRGSSNIIHGSPVQQIGFSLQQDIQGFRDCQLPRFFGGHVLEERINPGSKLLLSDPNVGLIDRGLLDIWKRRLPAPLQKDWACIMLSITG